MKLLLLLCLGLTLVCAHHEENHAVVTSNFDMSKLSRKWYSILLASDVKEKTEENRNMRVFIESMQALDNSSLLFKFHKEVNGECVELTFVTDETEEKGVYSFNYDGYNTFHITEAVYNDYIIFYLLNSNKKGTAQVMELVAQNSDVSLELKERFEELSQSYGIPKENILDMTHIDRCLQARGSN